MATKPDPKVSSTAHDRIRDYILELIERESLAVGARIPSENDLAVALGVSRMTANKAIQALVRDGWLSREQGSGTFVARVPTGVPLDRCVVDTGTTVANSVSDYYYGEMIATIRGRMLEYGIPVEFGNGIAHRRSHGRIGYVAMNPPPQEAASLRSLSAHGLNVVVLGASIPEIEDLCIDSDNVLGGLIATRHLIDHGHETIAFAGAFAGNPNTRDRLRGYHLACKASGLPVDPARELILDEDLYLTDEQEAAFVRLVSDTRTTAVFAAGPRLAMRVLLIARRLDRAVPDDLSIVSYDDPDFVQLATPPLTTVRQPLAAMANVACDRLFGLPSVAARLDPELVVRGTVARLERPR